MLKLNLRCIVKGFVGIFLNILRSNELRSDYIYKSRRISRDYVAEYKVSIPAVKYSSDPSVNLEDTMRGLVDNGPLSINLITWGSRITKRSKKLQIFNYRLPLTRRFVDRKWYNMRYVLKVRILLIYGLNASWNATERTYYIFGDRMLLCGPELID